MIAFMPGFLFYIYCFQLNFGLVLRQVLSDWFRYASFSNGLFLYPYKLQQYRYFIQNGIQNSSLICLECIVSCVIIFSDSFTFFLTNNTPNRFIAENPLNGIMLFLMIITIIHLQHHLQFLSVHLFRRKKLPYSILFLQLQILAFAFVLVIVSLLLYPSFLLHFLLHF